MNTYYLADDDDEAPNIIEQEPQSLGRFLFENDKILKRKLETNRHRISIKANSYHDDEEKW